MSSNTDLPRLAWIGLGNMGRGMVTNLVAKGKFSGPIMIHNRTTARAEKFAQNFGADKTRVARTVAAAVDGADIIFTCVSNDQAITETIDEALAAPASKGKGKLFVDCSTIHPDLTDALDDKITRAGAGFVACPVFGAPAMADAGQLLCVLAGPKELVERVRPFCKGVVGRAEVDLSGKTPGTATLLKIIGNTFILQMVEALSEGHALAEASGLGSEQLHQFIETMFPGPYAAYSTRLMTGDYYKRDEPLFSADGARKDAGHAMALAKKSGVKLRSVEVADDHLRMVQEHQGGAKGDIASIYGAVRKEGGMKYEV